MRRQQAPVEQQRLVVWPIDRQEHRPLGEGRRRSKSESALTLAPEALFCHQLFESDSSVEAGGSDRAHFALESRFAGEVCERLGETAGRADTLVVLGRRIGHIYSAKERKSATIRSRQRPSTIKEWNDCGADDRTIALEAQRHANAWRNGAPLALARIVVALKTVVADRSLPARSLAFRVLILTRSALPAVRAARLCRVRSERAQRAAEA
jgi:hypothetical protein